MKRILLLIFFISNFSNAQVVFCPAGAEWNYLVKWRGGGNPSTSGSLRNSTAKYLNDTVIGTETLKVLRCSYIFRACGGVGGDFFIRQKGDTIFFKGGVTMHQWQILFNFAAKPGEGWTSKVKSEMVGELTFTIMVDSTRNLIENGQALKQLYTTYKVPIEWYMEPDTLIYTATITERLGGNITIFNFDDGSDFGCDIDMFDRILCYRDDEFGLKQYGTLPCNYSYQVSINELTANNKVSVFPQPASQELQVLMGEEGIYTIRLFDLHARLLARLQVQGKSATIETASLSRGMYFLEIEKDFESLATKKIIIE